MQRQHVRVHLSDHTDELAQAGGRGVSKESVHSGQQEDCEEGDHWHVGGCHAVCHPLDCVSGCERGQR